MSQQLLNDPDICTGFTGQGGKGMAATVGGQVTNRRFHFPQSAKECVKVPGEIPGMENRTVFRAEQIFPGMGQMLEPVSQLRQKRNGAQTALCFGFMLRYTGPVSYTHLMFSK